MSTYRPPVAPATGLAPESNNVETLKCYYSISHGKTSIVRFRLRDPHESNNLSLITKYNQCGFITHCGNPIPNRFYRCTDCSQVMCKSCFKAQQAAGYHLKPTASTKFLLEQEEYFQKRYALSSSILIKIDNPQLKEELGRVMDRVETKAEEIVKKYEDFRKSLERRVAQLRTEQRFQGEAEKRGDEKAGGA